MVLIFRDGQIAESENSENERCLEHFLKGKELSDGAGNTRNRKISSRSFSNLVRFFSLLEKFVTQELLEVRSYRKNP